jgi:hypothetical protein
VFTGIPPHVVLMNELKGFKTTLANQTTNIVEAFKSELNARGLGGEIFQAQVIFEEIKTHQD